MRRSKWEGCAALVVCVSMDGNGRQLSLFRNLRAKGLNLITLSMMPKHMHISQMGTWLRSFERSGHALPRWQGKRQVSLGFRRFL